MSEYHQVDKPKGELAPGSNGRVCRNLVGISGTATRCCMDNASTARSSRCEIAGSLEQSTQRASLMCGNRAGCFNRSSNSAMDWPVSKAVELATERSTALRLGVLRSGVGVLGMNKAFGLIINSRMNFGVPQAGEQWT